MLKRLAFAALLMVLLGACNGSVPAVVPQGSQNTPDTIAATQTQVEMAATSTSPAATATDLPASPTPTQAPPTATATPVPETDPLTGLPAQSNAMLARRPLAVKIQLFPRSGRPTFGLAAADIIYDFYQNNGLTRLHAIFYGRDATQVGPIRSARLFDAAIINMYKSIFAFGGADKRILERLYSGSFADRLVVEGSNNCPPMCRVDPNKNNYLVTNTAELSKYADAKGMDNQRPDLTGMTFKDEAPSGGKATTQVFVHHSLGAYARWDYDAASRRYLRFQDTVDLINGQTKEEFAPLMDRVANVQLTADTVVVLLLPHTYVLKGANNEIIDITINGSGKAYAFRDGQVYEVKWNRPKIDSLVYLTTTDGQPFPFKPGTTWFEVMGQSSRIQTLSEGVMRFDFSIP